MSTEDELVALACRLVLLRLEKAESSDLNDVLDEAVDAEEGLIAKLLMLTDLTQGLIVALSEIIDNHPDRQRFIERYQTRVDFQVLVRMQDD